MSHKVSNPHSIIKTKSAHHQRPLKTKKILLLGFPKSIHIERWKEILTNLGYSTTIGFFDGDGGIYSIPKKLNKKLSKNEKIVKIGKRPRLPILRNLLFRLEMNVILKHLGWRAKSLKMLIHQWGFDLIIAHKLNYYGYIATSHPVNLISVVWGSEIFQDNSKFNLFRIRHTIKNSDLIFCQDEYMLAQLSEINDSDNIKLVKWGVDTRLFRKRNIKSIDSFPSDFIIKKKDKVIVFPRGLKKVYQGNLILRIIEKLIKIDFDLKIILFAHNFEQNQVFKLQKLRDHPSVFVQPKVVSREIFAKILGMSDICVSLAVSDQRSHTILEAMACENLLLLTELDAYKDLLKLDTVVSVKSMDTKKIVNQIIELLSNTILLDRSFENRRYIKKEDDQKTALETIRHYIESLFKD